MYVPDMAGCCDGGCIFKDNSRGMHTNGGCNCERELCRTEHGRKAIHTIRFLRNMLREELEKKI